MANPTSVGAAAANAAPSVLGAAQAVSGSSGSANSSAFNQTASTNESELAQLIAQLVAQNTNEATQAQQEKTLPHLFYHFQQ